MYSSRLFWKLFLTCGALNLLAALLISATAYRWQRQRILDDARNRLESTLLAFRGEADPLLARQDEASLALLQRQMEGLHSRTGLRITALAYSDGTVLADSDTANAAGQAGRSEIVVEGFRERVRANGEWYMFYTTLCKYENQEVGYLRAGLPMAPIDARILGLRTALMTVTAAAGLLVMAIAYWAIGRTVRSVQALSQSAEAIARGDYRQRAYVPRHDELGSLARTFNRMSQELDARTAQLSRSSQRQATVLGGMIEGVIAVDERERVVFANAAAGRLFGFRPAVVEGRPLLEVVRNHALHQAVAEAITSRHPQRLEAPREAGDKVTISIQATPLPGDPCPGAVLVLQDTTELRRLESLRQEFVANVSHELKTPLTSIKAYAETLRNGALQDQETSLRFIQRIEEQADRLHNLILDLLSLARIESEQQAFDIGPVRVADAVTACLDAYRTSAEAKNIRLDIDAGAAEAKVRADQEGLREMLDNLVDNAIKYTHDGGAVTVRWAERKGRVVIEVKDTGIGISQEDLPRVFERFYRVDKARSREMGGTGLGLSIVKHLAQSFGGSVGVSSERGKGSIFSVELPAA